MPDRDTLIKDDDDDEGNDCEQSDIVSIVLNMSYVPEEVLEVFKFETGFHKKFKPAMDSYLVKKGRPTIEQIKAAHVIVEKKLETPKSNILMSKLLKGAAINH